MASSPDALPPELDRAIDELLGLLPLVAVDPSVADRIFGPLVDCLAEAMLHELSARHATGALTRAAYLTEMCRTVVVLRERGILDGGRLPGSH